MIEKTKTVTKNEKDAPAIIINTCDNHFTFCNILTMHGKSPSRFMKSIFIQVRQLTERRVKKITVIAQDSMNYGIDIYDSFKLSIGGIAKVKITHALEFDLAGEGLA